MELKVFVEQTLVQIVEGVKAAQDRAKELGGIINICPHFHSGKVPIKEIEFDVVVTTSSGKETSGGIGVYVGAVGLGSRAKSEASHESISRIRFAVPVVFPSQEAE